MGRLRNELLPQLYSFPVGNYAVFYLATESGIEIIRILSQHPKKPGRKSLCPALSRHVTNAFLIMG